MGPHTRSLVRRGRPLHIAQGFTNPVSIACLKIAQISCENVFWWERNAQLVSLPTILRLLFFGNVEERRIRTVGNQASRPARARIYRHPCVVLGVCWWWAFGWIIVRVL